MLKRPRSPDDTKPATHTSPKRTKYEMSSKLMKTMAWEWAHREQAERLEEVGGRGFEYRLQDQLVDLQGGHYDDRSGTYEMCYTKKNVKVYGMWKCPDGGLLVCKACFNALSTFGA